MIEQTYILEGVDPVVFYGVNNGHLQLLRTLYPKLRIVARGNVMKVIGEEDELAVFLRKLREVERYCAERNALTEEVIIDLVKGNELPPVAQDHLIIYGVNGRAITARSANQQLLVDRFDENDLTFAIGPAGSGKTFVAIALAVAFIWFTIFPDALKSSVDSRYSLTLAQAAATGNTQTIMSAAALVFVPIVLGYTVWSYKVFSRRISVEHIPDETPGLDPKKVRSFENA